ncbi:MAG: radical SAM protein [Candidatus Shapirobacteria bacterium]|jgi:radical SAM superfamily enzyme YgiQ (UPF0313 family)
MKILLVSPPFYKILGMYNRYFPFGITILGTILEEKGYKVKVYDADYYSDPETIDYAKMANSYAKYLEVVNNDRHRVWKEVKRKIERFKPDVVGISVYTPFAASAFTLARIIRKNWKKCRIVFGGPHATIRGEEILRLSPNADYVVRGEAEETLVELMDYFKKGSKGEPKHIKGLLYRIGGKIIFTPDREAPKNLDMYPDPDRSLLLNEKELSSEDMGLIMTSRGCPYRCTYCASTKGLRYRSVDKVLEEIREVKKKYKTKQFTFKDDSFTVDKKRVEELCHKLIDGKYRINWECNTRVNLVDKDLLKLMKKAGCNFIKVGIESGSERILRTMNKGISLDQIRKAARLFNEAKIHWTGYFMMGVIGENEEDIRKTVALLKDIKPNLGVIATYEPFPGTVMFEEGIKRKLIKNQMSLKDYYTMYPSDYYKIDPKVQNDMISKERFPVIEKEVNEIFRKHNKKFNNVLAMALAKVGVYTNDPKVFWEDVKKLVSY